MKKTYYFDYAASTPTAPEVLAEMIPYFKDNFGNPSSFHYAGKRARDAVEKSRAKIAGILNCQPEEIIFTSGGTEANNLAVLGAARAAGDGSILVSAIEHHSVLEPANRLKEEGFSVVVLPVDGKGFINFSDFGKFIGTETVLVSIMYANNEIGVFQNIKEISEIIKKHNKARNKKNKIKNCIPNTKYKIQNTLLHTDASAAAGWLDLDVQKLNVDLMSLSAQKFYGPKGAGLLYVRQGVKLEPIIYGGFQEKGRRPGTENTAGIVGMAAALELAERRRKSESARLITLRDYLIRRILREIPKSFLNGDRRRRIGGNVNVTFLDIEGEALISYLAERGIFVSTGSACVSQSLDPSHVILALGHSYEAAHGSIRVTLGRETKKSGLDFLLENLKKGVSFLRRISPVKLSIKY